VYIIIMLIAHVLTGLLATPTFRDFTRATSQGRERFFLGSNNGSTGPLQNLSAVNAAIGVAELTLALINGWITFSILSLVYGVLPIIFWSTAKEFESVLETSSKLTSTKEGAALQKIVLEMYDNLKDLTKSINNIWPTSIFLQIIEVSLTVIQLNNIFIKRYLETVIYYIMDIVFTAISLTLMAEGAKIVSIIILIEFCIVYFKLTSISSFGR